MRQKRTYEELKGTEKMCYDFLKEYQEAIDDNTTWCTTFWLCICERSGTPAFIEEIHKYPPESLTKYRRNLIFDGLITPSEKSKQHSIEQELKNHKKEYQHNAENDWDKCFKSHNNVLNL